MEFAYLPESLKGPPGAAHPSGQTQVWRPFIPIRIVGPSTSMPFPQALVDPGSVDTVFPWGVHQLLGVILRADQGYVLRWRGVAHPMRFGDVEIELRGNGSVWRWPALVAFSQAPPPYVILGHFGFLQFLDGTFRGLDRLVDLETNSSYPGIKH